MAQTNKRTKEMRYIGIPPLKPDYEAEQKSIEELVEQQQAALRKAMEFQQEGLNVSHPYRAQDVALPPAAATMSFFEKLAIDFLKRIEAKHEQAGWGINCGANVGDLSRLLQGMSYDDPEMDGTDAAHAAWWRGADHATKMVVDMLTKALDGQDDGHGVVQCDELEALRRRLIDLWYRQVITREKAVPADDPLMAALRASARGT